MLVYDKHFLFNMDALNMKVVKTTSYYRLADSKCVHYRHARPLKNLFLFTALLTHCNTDYPRLTTEFLYDKQVVKSMLL